MQNPHNKPRCNRCNEKRNTMKEGVFGYKQICISCYSELHPDIDTNIQRRIDKNRENENLRSYTEDY